MFELCYCCQPAVVYRTASDQTVPESAADWLTETGVQGEPPICRHPPKGRSWLRFLAKKEIVLTHFLTNLFNRNLVIVHNYFSLSFQPLFQRWCKPAMLHHQYNSLAKQDSTSFSFNLKSLTTGRSHARTHTHTHTFYENLESISKL